MLVAGLGAAVLCIGPVTDLRAQVPGTIGQVAAPLRDGFHLSMGIGGGSVSASCDECPVDFFDDRLYGLSGRIQVGRAVSSKLVIAGELSGWLKDDGPVFRRIAAIGLVVLGYPSDTSGFFVKGGVGGLSASIEDDFNEFQTDAWTAQAGIGFDIVVGDAMVTPYASHVRTFNGQTWFDDIVSPVTVLPNAILLGMAFTVH
jgi:hypothetical protein